MLEKQRIWGMFAHASIIIGMMFVVFFVIDLFNPAMEFLTSSISKWLMLVLALCAIFTGLYSAIFLFQKQKRREEKRTHPPVRTPFEKENESQQRQSYGSAVSREYQSIQSQRRSGYPAQYPGYAGEQPNAEYERSTSYQR